MRVKNLLNTFSLGLSAIMCSTISLAETSNSNFDSNRVLGNVETVYENQNIFISEIEKNEIYNFELRAQRSLVNNPVITESKVLSFGDNFSYNFESNVTWVIKNEITQAILSSGSGNISNFNFAIPGNYVVEVSENLTCIPGECDHSHYPDIISILVSPHKMTFDFSTVSFQEPIIGGQDYTDLEVNVVVYYENYNNANGIYSGGSVRSAGVQTTFTGTVDSNFQEVIPGMNEILYKVSGNATKDSYIMFDFVDINNQVVSYYYPTKIN